MKELPQHYKHEIQSEKPFALSESEKQFIVKKKMQQGLTWEEAHHQVYQESKFIFKKEMERVDKLKEKRIFKEENKHLGFKDAFNELRARSTK